MECSYAYLAEWAPSAYSSSHIGVALHSKASSWRNVETIAISANLLTNGQTRLLDLHTIRV